MEESTLWKENPAKAFSAFVRTTAYQQLGRRPPAVDANGNIYPLRDNSVRVLTAMFRKFAQYLNEHGLTIYTAEADHLHAFLQNRAHPKRTGDRPSLQRMKYLQILDRVFQHLKSVPNPAQQAALTIKEVPVISGRNEERQALTDEQRQAFLTALPGSPASEWMRRRDGAMLALILGSGLLPSEAVALYTSNVKVYRGVVTRIEVVMASTGNMSPDHDTLLHEDVQERVLAWMQERKRSGIPGKYLFPSSKSGKRMDLATLYRHARQAFEQAGIDVKRQGCRTLRNTFAEREIAHGTPIEKLQEYLGLYHPKSAELYSDENTMRRQKMPPS